MEKVQKKLRTPKRSVILKQELEWTLRRFRVTTLILKLTQGLKGVENSRTMEEGDEYECVYGHTSYIYFH